MPTPEQNAAVNAAAVAAAALAAPEPDAEVEGLGAALNSPEAGVEEEPVAAAPGALAPYKVTVPTFVPMKEMTDQRTEWITGFEGAAAQSGIKAEGAQTLVDALTDVVTSIPYTVEHAYATPEDAAQEMAKMYGPEQATTLVRDAQRYYAKLGAPMQKYLNETGLGDDPGVLTVLALGQSGLFHLSPEKAQAEIHRIMASKSYSSPDAKERLLNVVKVQILSRLANRSTAPPPHARYLNAAAKASVATAKASADGVLAARKEAADMMADREGPLLNSGHRDHAAAVQKWHQLIGRL